MTATVMPDKKEGSHIVSEDNAPAPEAPETATVEESAPEIDPVDKWKAQAREWEKRAKGNAAAEKERDELAKRLAEIEASSKTEREKELEKVRKETEAAVRGEVMTTANRRLVRSEVRVAAAGRLNDPEDAVRFLSLDDFEVGEDGEVDSKAITQAIETLLKEKPYLGAKSSRPSGNVDQGARSNSSSADVQPGHPRLARAYANSERK